jgi:hypothetical protein
MVMSYGKEFAGRGDECDGVMAVMVTPKETTKAGTEMWDEENGGDGGSRAMELAGTLLLQEAGVMCRPL